MDNNSLVIRELTQKNALSVYTIWRECFTDDEFYIKTFIERCFPFGVHLGIFKKNDNQALSMLSLLPCHIKTEEKRCYGAYMYGVGTLIKHRGNQYSTLLANEAFRKCKEKGYHFIVVRPAEESLYNLYSKQGFKLEVKSSTISYNINQLLIAENNSKTTITSTKINQEELYSIKSITQQKTHILLSKEITNYAHIEILQRNGICEKIQTEKRDLFLCAYPDETHYGTIKITDHNIITPEDLLLCTKAIQHRYPESTSVTIELPNNIESSLDSFLKKNSDTIDRISSKNCMISYLTSLDLQNKHLSLAME